MSTWTAFVVEDDKRLLKDIVEICEENGWKPVTARSVEEALQVSAQIQDEIKLALVDMMIPQTKQDGARLDEELTKRDAIIRERTRAPLHALSQDELESARLELVQIDLRVQQLVNLTGGLDYLADVGPAIKKWKVAVFSARSSELGQQLLDIVATPNWLGWLQKPLDPDDLVKLLGKAKRGTDDVRRP